MISLVCGPMFSGKTTEVIRRLERAHLAGKSVVFVRPPTDTRNFITHTRFAASWMEQVREDLASLDAMAYDVIGVDEGQFQPNLRDFCLKYSALGKHVIVSALHATSESEMFDPIVELIPHCEEIEKLNAVCTQCGSDFGNYTYYLSGKKTAKVVVGDGNDYTALCGECYRIRMG